MGVDRAGQSHLVEEIPDEALSEAELPPPQDHDHDDVAAEDGTLRAHLRRIHHLEAPDAMSSSTQVGVHDRLHYQTGAADD